MYEFVGMDLDNTLYDYDENSKRGVDRVFKLIQEAKEVPLENLWDAYMTYIRQSPGPYLFKDGRLADEYRFDRINAVLKMCGIEDEELAKGLVYEYSSTLLSGIVPFEGVPELFEELEQNILIITDAPRDVQLQILDKLGVSKNVYKLYTPTESGEIKEGGGLFRYALNELGCEPGDIIHVGDSPIRDVQGAQEAGIRGIFLNRPLGFFTQRLIELEGLNMTRDEREMEEISDIREIKKFL